MYKNTVAGGPYTDISINIEINGKFETDETNNILNNKDIDTLIYGSYISSLLDKSKGVSAGLQDYGSAFEVNTFFQNYITASVGRWATPLSVILIPALTSPEAFIKSLPAFE